MSAELRNDVLTAARQCRLWHGVAEEDLRALVSAGTVMDVPAGTPLATAGDAADRLGLVVAGKVRIYHAGADGRTIILETVESGQVFGAVPALAGGRYPASADSATPATVVMLPREALLAMLDRNPPLARTMIGDLALQVMNLTNVVQTLALDVPGRLARYLFQRSLAVGEATHEGLRVSLGMSKAELAASLGTVPETLSRALARLREEGLLEVRGAEVIVHDVGALARLGSGYE